MLPPLALIRPCVPATGTRRRRVSFPPRSDRFGDPADFRAMSFLARNSLARVFVATTKKKEGADVEASQDAGRDGLLAATVGAQAAPSGSAVFFEPEGIVGPNDSIEAWIRSPSTRTRSPFASRPGCQPRRRSDGRPRWQLPELGDVVRLRAHRNPGAGAGKLRDDVGGPGTGRFRRSAPPALFRLLKSRGGGRPPPHPMTVPHRAFRGHAHDGRLRFLSSASRTANTAASASYAR